MTSNVGYRQLNTALNPGNTLVPWRINSTGSRCRAAHLARSRPLGDPQWLLETAQRLGLEHTLRSPGRQPGWRKAGKSGKRQNAK